MGGTLSWTPKKLKVITFITETRGVQITCPFPLFLRLRMGWKWEVGPKTERVRDVGIKLKVRQLAIGMRGPEI